MKNISLNKTYGHVLCNQVLKREILLHFVRVSV